MRETLLRDAVLGAVAILCVQSGAVGQQVPQQPALSIVSIVPETPTSGVSGAGGVLVHDFTVAPVTVIPVIDPEVEQLLAFRDSDVRFRVPDLMEILRDRRHEGWVLSAYPDPKTKRPLIGAGVSLDLPEREHPQRDMLNPHPFLEPSSEQLWKAAGMEPERLHRILTDYQTRLSSWGARGFRRNIGKLPAQVTDDEATGLLRVAAIQAIQNARAYCRRFDELTASQQLALSQLVYQMGVNLEEFSQFLALINNNAGDGDAGLAAQSDLAAAGSQEYWRTVQGSLIHSQWARLYRVRAVAVIAMLDPGYAQDPQMAERRIAATLHPAVAHRRGGRRTSSVRTASAGSDRATRGRKTHSAQSKRRA